MPRPRVVLPDVATHITHRGIDRGPTFLSEEDFAYYRWALGEVASTAGCRVHAYALVRAALDAGLARNPIAVAQTQPYGCDVKY